MGGVGIELRVVFLGGWGYLTSLNKLYIPRVRTTCRKNANSTGSAIAANYYYYYYYYYYVNRTQGTIFKKR